MATPRGFLMSVLPSRNMEKFDREGERIPLVTLTFAQSLDESMLMTHWMRTMHDAIVVGIGTALNDDPQLNVRLIPGATKSNTRSPCPVVLDTYLRLRTDCRLLKNYRDGTGRQPWIFCGSDPESTCPERSARKSALEAAGAVVYEIPCVSGFLSIPSLLRKLYKCDIRSVMVEGGASVIDAFMNQASQPRGPEESPVVDTLIVTVAPTIVGGDGLGYMVGVPGDKQSGPKFVHVRTELMGKDAIIAGKFV